eukprot:6918058-Prymnesium_polylepis.1
MGWTAFCRPAEPRRLSLKATSRHVALHDTKKVRTAIAQAVAKSTPGSGWGRVCCQSRCGQDVLP